MTRRLLPCVLALSLLTAACSHSDADVEVLGGDSDVLNKQITLHNDVVTIKAPGAPNATVDSNGTLSIDGHAVAVNEAQRALLQRYNGGARQIREDAIATGKAGVATAQKAIGAAAGKLTGADSAEETKQKVEAAKQDVRATASRICDDLATMKSAQDELAPQLDAFKPYAQALNDADVAKCRDGLRH
ncbi:DUF2884 family protein [Dyella sp. ASV21]|jgi:hypothetical protein|uniref:DUF2884 family protein n=1 Tax=Dyella sp. ASV21 TaxID=2795114 RepID=UPI0018ED8B5D|nr:DUF2884 family protein [Dyella sp. ASV21]